MGSSWTNVVVNVVKKFPSLRPLVSLKMKKSLKTNGFQGFLRGGDKRDRTADLLNAMSAIREQNESECIL